ncbi:MAG: hypothetical protein A3G41_03830 [Elusimicrobia bacterium RIFCSPLOWO2_12_FULL_59_9]|nr:MAG: hypothetical protein A3G41_03830 [Elusimicrobia bacterium RIFCSPLOWO2_12_FULL_59_9]
MDFKGNLSIGLTRPLKRLVGFSLSHCCDNNEVLDHARGQTLQTMSAYNACPGWGDKAVGIISRDLAGAKYFVFFNLPQLNFKEKGL